MNRFSFARFTHCTLARALRLSTVALLSIMLGLLLPLFAPAAHAQSAAHNEIVSWGNGSSDTPPAALANQSIIAIGAGQDANIAATSDGQVISWGAGCENRTIPNVVAVDIGFYTCMALKRDGTVVAWGDNSYGQSDVPAGLTDVTAIAAGKAFNLALKRDGTVVAWGDNEFGQLNMPADLHDVTAIAAGWWNSMALKRDGTVVAWGNRASVQDGLRDVTAIAVGGDHYLALKRDGTVVAWGYNDNGQVNVPADLRDVTAISAGLYHSMALKRDGTVVAWGDSTFATVPAGLSHVTAIAAGFAHSLALVESADSLPALPHSSSIDITAAPRSVVENVWESNTLIRLFPERQNYTLPTNLTVNGKVIAAGTKVNVFYIHADKVGNDNSKAIKLSGSVTFATRVLAVISDGATLRNTHSTLGSATTAYSSSVDQGIDYGDKATLTGDTQLNLAFSLWNMTDDVRVITLAE